MAAELTAASGACCHHLLRLPAREGAAGLLEEVSYALSNGSGLRGPVLLSSGDWDLHTGDLRDLRALLASRELHLVAVQAACPTTLVAASALGLSCSTGPDGGGPPEPGEAGTGGLLVHRGTLRSGDHLQTEGSVLLLGDVNPGGRISAGGHVLVWGRLRGVAHAGRHGDASARIVALQLRPLQLRIAGAVARGPEDLPPEGLAEEARLEDGEIRIEPASPTWPVPAAEG